MSDYRAILPADLVAVMSTARPGLSYLAGPDHDRVTGICLRGELSEGVTISRDYVKAKMGLRTLEELSIGQDISEALSIQKYEPPLPPGFSGKLERLETEGHFRQHDAEQFGIFGGEFQLQELVIATEKVHGSQANILVSPTGQVRVTSKGLASSAQGPPPVLPPQSLAECQLSLRAQAKSQSPKCPNTTLRSRSTTITTGSHLSAPTLGHVM